MMKQIMESKHLLLISFIVAILTWLALVPYIISNIRIVAIISIIIGLLGGFWVLCMMINIEEDSDVFDKYIKKVDTHVLKTDAENKLSQGHA